MAPEDVEIEPGSLRRSAGIMQVCGNDSASALNDLLRQTDDSADAWGDDAIGIAGHRLFDGVRTRPEVRRGDGFRPDRHQLRALPGRRCLRGGRGRKRPPTAETAQAVRMSLTLPDELAYFLDLIGFVWPEADDVQW